ncbi:btk-binding protein-related [Anaeramoeba flamelloides]|uniref:Btk-binding protein-related n=1 Tax=Anaeramoeba flamelloides TaxID=1746091 RepID=A0ABQ8Z0F8_9EUKA|nr:btk-binding protein-related [Anaeramoeba flamelloides]
MSESVPQSKIFLSGSKRSLKYLLDPQEERKHSLPNWTSATKIQNQQKIKKILINGNAMINRSHHSDFNCLVWKGTNKLEFHTSSFDSSRKSNKKQKKKFRMENERIKEIQCGISTFLILTETGKVFSLAEYNKRGKSYPTHIPLQDFRKSTFNKIRPIPFFNKDQNNRKVKSIAMTSYSNYYLCFSNKLYANGDNEKGQLGDGTNKSKMLPVFIQDNVSRIFGGDQSNHFFFTTNTNELFGCGYNYFGQLANRDYHNQNLPKKVPDWNASDILNIYCARSKSILITKRGGIYVSGSIIKNGLIKDIANFTQIQEFKNKKVINVACGNFITLCLTSKNEMYGWGFRHDDHPTNQYQNLNDRWDKPRKINLPQFYRNNHSIRFELFCGYSSIVLYSKNIDCLKQDFKNVFESKKYCDSNLVIKNKNGNENGGINKDKDKDKDKNKNKNKSGNENENKNEKKNGGSKKTYIPVHKLLIELRTGLKIKQIQKIINKNNFGEKGLNKFLKWVYYDHDEITNEKLIIIFNSFNLNYPPPKNSLESDLYKLFKDEKSKDFFILVQKQKIIKKKKLKKIMKLKKSFKKKIKIKDDEQNKNKIKIKEEEEVEGYEKIPVHKLILLIRSSLYRDMFDNLNEKEKNINQIKDYTGKSMDALQIFIKYLYINKIAPREVRGPKLIFEELQDSVEYYQLNNNSNLLDELKQLKN